MRTKSFADYVKEFTGRTGMANDSRKTLITTSGDSNDKKAFLSVLAHELRNPLSVIVSSVELLRLEKNTTPEYTSLLKTIEERVRFMTSLLDEMLDISNTPSVRSTHSPLPPDVVRRSAETSAAGLSIVVVDDNEMAANSLAQLLKLSGHSVRVAYSGIDGIEAVRKYAPQILFLDIGLPDVDGYEVLRILKAEKNFSTAAIALTGYGQAKDKEQARKTGFALHLTKPVTLKEIEAALKKVRSMQPVF